MKTKCSSICILQGYKIIFLITFMGTMFGFTNLSAQHWLSVGEVYDFEIGDLFVTSGYSESASGGWHDTENRQTEMEVIDKQWSASGDTVFYYFDMKSWKRTLVSGNDWEVNINHDTVMRSHSMLDSLMIDIVFNNYIQKYADPNHMHGRIRNELVNASDTYDATVNGYTEGLGSIRYTRTTYTSTYRNDLIYYKKGEEEWGSYTPISIDEQYVKNSASPISQMLADNFTKTGIKKDKPDLNTIVQHKGKQVESKEPCSSCLPGGIVFRTQTQIDEFHTNYPECTNIEGDVTIWGFDIANLNGLNMLTSIGGNFRVFACYTLTSLNGLDSLTSIEGNLEIIANNSLTSLSGIENLEAASIDQLTIINNSSLSSCEAQWLCEYLSSPNSEFELSNNASGCNSIIEVAAGCGGMPCLTDDDYVFNTQSEIDLFEAAFPNCTDLEGNVTINGIDITNLAGLGMITSIAGNLTIHGCEGLTSLTGLDNLNSVGNDLIIYKNYNLSSLNGTENLYSVGGNLKLYSLPDLSSLNGLDGLNNIGVNFRIYNCNTLTSLTGLENLTSIGGYLWIDHNAGLSNLNGMENLTSVDGNLWIHTNTALTSLSGLENLTSVGKNFRLFFNTALTSLSGLESLTSIGDYLWVKNNPVLTSLSGLDNLNTIGDYLWVDDNKVLSHLNGLEGLNSIEGNFWFTGNDSLSELPELNSLTSIGGNLWVNYNITLTSLSGLDNLEAASIDQLIIVHNSSLSSCEAQWLCEYLSSPNSEFEISNNASGCNSIIEVAAGCGGMPCLTNDDYVFNTQLEIDLFEAAFPNCTDLEGNVTINGIDITNLAGLGMITSIAGNLTIHGCDGLTSLTGLDNLSSVGNDLNINNNNVLASLNGLEDLSTIGANLKIENNDFLYNLNALEELTSIGGNLQIIENDTLTSLSGIENLEAASIDQLTIIHNSSLSSCEAQWLCEYLSSPNCELEISNNASGCNSIIEVAADCGGMPCLTDDNYVFNTQLEIDLFEVAFPNCTDLEGNVTINGIDITNLAGLGMITSIAGNLTIHDCDGLSSLIGLESLVSISDSLNIMNNNALISLNGLENLTTIGANLKIENNDFLYNLTSLEGLTSIEGNLQIIENDTLTSLRGLDNLEAASITDLQIVSNPLLEKCEVNSICNYLSEPGGTIEIHDNAPGCSNPQQVENACEKLDVEELAVEAEFMVFPNPAKNKIYLTSKNDLKIETFTIYNQIGQKVFHRNETVDNIDISALESGIYFLELISGELTIKQKLIVSN